MYRLRDNQSTAMAIGWSSPTTVISRLDPPLSSVSCIYHQCRTIPHTHISELFTFTKYFLHIWPKNPFNSQLLAGHCELGRLAVRLVSRVCLSVRAIIRRQMTGSPPNLHMMVITLLARYDPPRGSMRLGGWGAS